MVLRLAGETILLFAGVAGLVALGVPAAYAGLAMSVLWFVSMKLFCLAGFAGMVCAVLPLVTSQHF